jgi:hypothetical protein
MNQFNRQKKSKIKRNNKLLAIPTIMLLCSLPYPIFFTIDHITFAILTVIQIVLAVLIMSNVDHNQNYISNYKKLIGKKRDYLRFKLIINKITNDEIESIYELEIINNQRFFDIAIGYYLGKQIPIVMEHYLNTFEGREP